MSNEIHARLRVSNLLLDLAEKIYFLTQLLYYLLLYVRFASDSPNCRI